MDPPSFPAIDLFAAGVNALNGVLIARNPKHNRGYTVAGLLLMAFFGGIGGGIVRDVLLNQIPGPLKNVNFLIVSLLAGILGLVIYRFVAARGELFRTRTLAFFKSFTLPWFAILGAQKALEQDLGVFAAVVVGLAATTAGGVVIDLISGVTPEIVEPAQYLVATAVIAGGVYAVIAMSGVPFIHATLIAALVAFVFRLVATHRHWREIVPETPAEATDAPIVGIATATSTGEPGASVT